MPEHTPGPWRATQGDLLRVTTAKKKVPLVICGVHRLGKYGGPSEGDPLANAHLIAAAPELLELAKLLARTVEYEIRRDEKKGDDEGARLKSMTLHQVREVIAKAEGRAP